MKRRQIIFFTIIFSLSVFIHAQSPDRQILIPKTIFVGDTAELKINFEAPSDYIENSGTKNNSTRELSITSFETPVDETQVVVKKVLLTKNGYVSSGNVSYTLSIFFVPWHTGKVKIPPYSLSKEFPVNTESGFLLVPDEFTVTSIFSQPNIKKEFVSSKGPLLIPGTTYKILFLIIFAVLLLAVVLRICFKWRNIALHIKNAKLRRRYKKNKKDTIKALKNLVKSESDDRFIAGEIQTIMRNYLQVRFDYPFTKCVSSRIAEGFYNIYGDLLSDAKESAAESLTGVFIRTDYVRYSREGKFLELEKGTIVNTLTDIILILEDNSEVQK